MANSTKRTSVCLAIVAILFILTIIILILAPEACRRRDPRPECRPKAVVSSNSYHGGSQDTTLSTSSVMSTTPSTSTSDASTDISTTDWEDRLINVTTEISSSTKVTTMDSYENMTSSSDIFSSTTVASMNETTEVSSNTTDFSSDATEKTTFKSYMNETSETTFANETSSTTDDSFSNTTTEEVDVSDNMTTISDFSQSTTTELTSNETTMMTETTSVTPDEITPFKPKKDYCDTPICREVARRMLDIMDPEDVDPCEDFYQFSCGGIIDDPFLKPEDPQVIADNIVKEALLSEDRDDSDLKALWLVHDSCVNYTNSRENENTSQIMQESIASVYSKMDNVTDLSSLLATLMKLNFAPLFDVSFRAVDNGFEIKMTLSETLTLMPESTCQKEHEDYPDCKTTGDGLDARIDKIRKTMRILNDLPADDEALESKLDDLKSMLTQIAQVYPAPDPMETDPQETNPNQMDMGITFGITPMNFTTFFSILLGEVQTTEDEIGNIAVHVYSKEVMQGIFNVTKDYFDRDPELLHDMILLLWAERLQDHLLHPLNSVVPNFCFNFVKEYMDDYVSYAYLKALPDQGEKLQTKIEQLFNIHHVEAIDQLGKSSSSSDDIDRFIELKVVTPAIDVMRTDILKEDNLSETSNFVDHYITVMRNYRNRLYTFASDSHTPESDIDKFMWSQLQQTYTAQSKINLEFNRIMIPYAALAAPLYYEGAPEYINYAGIGHTIAHQMMHSFDLVGLNNNSVETTALEAKETLFYQMGCLAEKESSGLSAGSNKFEPILLDSAATQLTWQSYQRAQKKQRSLGSSKSRSSARVKRYNTDLGLPHLKKYSHLQLYLIKRAQIQCSASSDELMETDRMPPKQSVNMVMGNHPLFLEAFQCSANSTMRLKLPCDGSY